jgi:predicted dehydrogenase
MRIGIIGCGYVADLYVGTLRQHPGLELVGVTDQIIERAARLGQSCGVKAYSNTAEMLADKSVELVLNLTNPRSHYGISSACLQAGKHVYSEKPLGMKLTEAEELVRRAEAQNLQITSAPCSLLGETAQTLWKALREKVVGDVRLVYAELDDGMIHRMPYRKWFSSSGVPWPLKDELEVGCTLEHAAYYLTWLVAFFGRVESVTAFSSCRIPSKQIDPPLEICAPDFSVACLKFQSGVVARLTTGIVAPHDHSLRIVGDRGILATDECWKFRGKVYIQRPRTIRRKTFISPWRKRYPLVRSPYRAAPRRGAASMDFCRGVAEMAAAIEKGKPPPLSARFSLHINEVTLAIQSSGEAGSSYRPVTTFEPVSPMSWGL